MKKWSILVAATAAGLSLVAGGGYLYARHNCWFCEAPELFDWGTERLCSEKPEARQKGFEALLKAAGDGETRALALAGEVFLDKLPFGFQSTYPAQSACAHKQSTPDKARGLGYFRQLTDGRGLAPLEAYNLGILIKNGMVVHPQGTKQALLFFQEAAHGGVGAGLYQLGLDEHRHERFDEAAILFEKTWEQYSNPDAALMLGDYDYKGQIGSPDFVAAAKWYQQALSVIPDTNQALRLKAENRLALAEQKLAQSEPAPLVLTYRLEGTPDTYIIYLNEVPDVPIGTVTREGEKILASIAEKPQDPATEGATTEAPQSEHPVMEVESMNQGLMQVLEGFARERFGTERPHKFIPAGE